MIESYEHLRDNSDVVPSEAREAWIKADQAERMLKQAYQGLIQDDSLNDEYRRRRAQELYKERKEGIETKKRQARQTLLKHARFAEKNSIPRPQGEALSSTDPTKLLLDQNEAGRIVRTVERRKGQSPFRLDTGELLRQEYARGLKIGNTEGGAIRPSR